MNRNVESHFAELPKLDIERSMFDRSSSHKTSFNVGQLIPFYIDEVLPGDTFNVMTSCVVRLQTPLTPIMDNIYMDTYYFFVPNRIVWDHWKEFCGESNAVESWTPDAEYTIPQIVPPDNGWNSGTLADYFGLPVGVSNENGIGISHLPFRAYALICAEWFRDQNLQDSPYVYKGDAAQVGTNGTSQITDIQLGGTPFIVNKYHDYFTSCLPSPQKGPDVGLFGNRINQDSEYSNYVPVITRVEKSFTGHDLPGVTAVGASNTSRYIDWSGDSDPYNIEWTASAIDRHLKFNNLWADVGQLDLSINQLRLAFQLQKFYERNARAGTRYREILKSHFGITSSDARMQIPEYLGGHRFPLSIHQVANTSQNVNDGDSSFLGDLGAMSNTSDINEDFVKSFEEHGYVIGVCCVRYDHSYVQGYERFWRRNRLTDFYFPVFANIGEQPVYKSEIYVDSLTKSDDVFGYQEAWADYRYKPNRVSGEMRPGIDNSLATWHLSDFYESTPSLSASWIREDVNNVDRVLSVSHDVANQVFADFYVRNIATRPMPMYSIPGLIDHH